jgi:hypothetical protein
MDSAVFLDPTVTSTEYGARYGDTLTPPPGETM